MHHFIKTFLCTTINEQNNTTTCSATRSCNFFSSNRSNAEKDPDEWITGAEPMTGAQKSYLKTLSDEAGEEFDENLSKAAASKRIEELQQKTGRGLENK